MLSINKLKYVQSLHRKKYRQKYNKIIVEGAKLCSDLLAHKNVDIEYIFHIEGHIDPSLKNVNAQEVQIIDVSEMKKISLLKNPSPILMTVNLPKFDFPTNQSGQFLFLDQIQDPGNLGTILRTSDWYGMDGVLLSENTVEVYNPKVIQASMGSCFNVPTKTLSYQDLQEWGATHQIVAADMSGDALQDFVFDKNSILILGNEGQGISPDCTSIISARVHIPKNNDKVNTVESLNVATAASILIHHMKS